MDEPSLSDLISQRAAELEAELPPESIAMGTGETYFELVMVQDGVHKVLTRMTSNQLVAHNGEITFKFTIY